MNNSARSLSQSALMITAISACGKILGLLRESTFAAFYGATAESDAYKTAFSIPMVLLVVISSSIASIFIPVYSELAQSNDKDKIMYFTNNIFNIVLFTSIGITVLCMPLVPGLIRVMAPGFDAYTYRLTVLLARIALPCLIFQALFNLGSSYLQSNNRFIASALAWVVYDGIIIGGIILLNGKGIIPVAVASVAAVAGLFATLIFSIYKTGFRYHFIFDLNEAGVKRIAYLIVPVLLSSGLNQIHTVVDKILASGLDEGSISALDYANRLDNVVFNVFILSFITVIYPNLSMASGHMERFKSSVEKGIRMIMLIALPTTFRLSILRIPIINLLFERGLFDARDTALTSMALGCYSLGIVGVGFRELLSRAFYSLQDTRTPMMNGVIAICTNIILSIILVRILGVGGLAMAASLSAIVSGGMLFLQLRKKIGNINEKGIVAAGLRIFTAAAVMGAVIYYLNNNYFGCSLQMDSLLARAAKLASNIGIGGIVYILMLHLLKVKEAYEASAIVKEKLKQVLKIFSAGCYENEGSRNNTGKVQINQVPREAAGRPMR